MVFGINTLLVLVMVRHSDTQAVAGLGWTVLFFAATGTGSFLATAATPAAVGRWGRYRTANGALAFAAMIQLAGSGLYLPMMRLCGFLLGVLSRAAPQLNVFSLAFPLRVVVALGAFGWDAALRALSALGHAPATKPRFGHGAEAAIGTYLLLRGTPQFFAYHLDLASGSGGEILSGLDLSASDPSPSWP
jgi:hypothetical protein